MEEKTGLWFQPISQFCYNFALPIKMFQKYINYVQNNFENRQSNRLLCWKYTSFFILFE